VLIAAATGDSREEDGTLIPFPDGVDNSDIQQGQTPALNQIIGNYTTDISYDMITEVTEKYMFNDIDPDTRKIFVISPAQARKLLQLTEATSGDYNAVRPLTSKGYIESWMGYTWVVSTRLGTGGGAGTRDIFSMTDKAIGLQINRDITARIAESVDNSFMWRIYCYATYGAIRVEDKQVVWCQVSE
jgi:hypothetical protein